MSVSKVDFGEAISEGVMKAISTAAAGIDYQIIPEFTCVRSLTEIREGDEVVPAGAEGAVVNILGDGRGYAVEFVTPVHAVVTARRNQLAII
jgi:hypothetical protein